MAVMEKLNPNMLDALARDMTARPWEFYQEPFQMLDQLYCLPGEFVNQYLVDTGDGLVLLDAGIQESVYLLVDSIHRLGFDPRDIRHLFLTHGHFDHIGGARLIQEISGCKIYFPPDDLFFLTERRDLIIMEDHVPEFQVDVQYDYQSVYEIGDCAFWAEHSPGHTPGTSSVFYRVTHGGKPVVCAIQGGMGFNGLSRAELAANGLPVSLQWDYVNSLLRQADLHVDCYTPAHHPGYNILNVAAQDDGRSDVFINASVWPSLLRSRAEIFQKQFAEELKLSARCGREGHEPDTAVEE